MKPICHPCQRFFRMKKSGYYFTEGMPVRTDPRVPPGTAEPEGWRPYKVWAGDLWQCPGCQATIISGTGLQPVAVQHEDKFKDIRKRIGADQFQVNDC